jgi:hypothetical protein
MELALQRRKQFSHSRPRIRWPKLKLNLIELARANRIEQELERSKHRSLRRNLTNSVLNQHIL